VIRQAQAGIWCDYCKMQHGKNKDGSWRLAAQSPAWVTIISESPRARKGSVRHYCRRCAMEVQQWHNGEIFTLMEQVEYALMGEPLNV
jgi:hypothetical protein